MTYTYAYRRPALTADAVVICEADRSVLLIERKNEPFQGKWALPGGFVDEEEEPFSACVRELGEETQLDMQGASTRLVGVYGKKGRDPRGWMVSVAYLFIVPIALKQKAMAGSDSSNVEWFGINGLPELAFDHDEIIQDAIAIYNKKI